MGFVMNVQKTFILNFIKMMSNWQQHRLSHIKGSVTSKKLRFYP